MILDMKKLITFTLISIGTLVTIEVKAQYVEKVGASIFIDVENMPSGSWTTLSLNDSYSENHIINNLRKRFEVANSNETATMTWANAKAICNAKGAGWRLPTQKELQLMWILNDLIKAVGGNQLINTVYWSNTLYSSLVTSSWGVELKKTDPYDQNSRYSARCVREF